MSLLRFEMGTILKSPAFLLVGLFALVFGFLVIWDEMGPAMETLNVAAAHRFHFYAICSGFLIPLILLIGVQLTFTRDRLTAFHAIAQSLQQRLRFQSKWFALFLLTLLWASLVSLAMALCFAMKMGSFPNLGFVVRPWLFYTLPNVWIGMNLMVWASRRWSAFFTPIGLALAIWIAIWIAMAWVGFPLFGVAAERSDLMWWISFMEPFGLTTFFHETQYWNVEMRNLNTLPLSLPLIINRGLWLLISFVLFFKQPQERISHEGNAPRQDTLKPTPPFKSLTPAKPPLFPLFWFEVRKFYGSLPGLLILLAWIGLCWVGILMTRGVLSESISPRLPSTSLLVSYMAEPFYPFSIMAGFICVQLVFWRERNNSLDGIWAGLPNSNSLVISAKLFAVCTLPIALMFILVLVGHSYQWFVGFETIDYGHWLQCFLVFAGPPLCHLIFSGCLAMLGYFWRWHFLTALLASAAFLFCVVFVPNWLHWSTISELLSFPNLLREHSEMRGYGLQWHSFLRVLILWFTFCVPLFFLVVRICPRPGKVWSKLPLRLGLTCFLIVFLTLGFQTKKHEKPDLTLAKVDYEKRWSTFLARGVPQIRHMENQIDLYPEQTWLEVISKNQVENTTGQPIRELLITSRMPLTHNAFSEPSEIEKVSSELNVYLVKFQSPWLPGDIMDWHYQLKWQGNSFDIQAGLDRSSSYFLQSEFEPLLGYYEGLEIRDSEIRERHGLPEKSFPRQDTHRFGDRFIQKKRTFATWISTIEGQTPVSSGMQVEEKQADGRLALKYVSEEPVYPILGYFSAPYQQRQFQVERVPVTIYFHPSHNLNLEMMEQSIRETMTFCAENFGEYPYSELRVVEIPATFPTGGRASAGVVALNEAGLFMLDPNPGYAINTVVRRTVHEVAHQWFGEKMVPKLAPGEKILNESLTKYVEAKVVEKMLGSEMKEKINRASHHRYLAGKSRVKEEVPLIEANDYYLAYGKGSLVFQEISDRLGEQRFHQALLTFMEKHRDQLTATMPDLLTHLKEHANSKEAAFIEEKLAK